MEYSIIKHIAVLGENKNGWRKELNIVSWNGHEPKYDIREWSADHVKMSRGVTLTESELSALKGAL